jgi:4-hydroxy-3-methylbut-2-en-1-yl diphosphate reductase
LIHNPEVNDNLEAMKVQFIEKIDGDVPNQKDFSKVKDGDVVILPAFGASYEEMDMLDKKNVEIVDTTCPWVSKVWNTVDMHQKKGLTSIIHGKYAHEETVATTSFCEDYICVKDMKEAEMVVDYILNGGDKEAFMKYFEKAVSKGFDPDTMLDKVGLANQTTMYKKETRAIGQLFQKAMMKKFGPVDASNHYMEFDTICDATQVSLVRFVGIGSCNHYTNTHSSRHHATGTPRCRSRIGRECPSFGIGLYLGRRRMGFVQHGTLVGNPCQCGNSSLPHQQGRMHHSR